MLGRLPSADVVDHATDTAIDTRNDVKPVNDVLPSDRVLLTNGGRLVAIPWRYQLVRKYVD